MKIYDWNDYSEFFEWEMQQVNSHQFEDVNLWLELSNKFGSPILELGCGEGRITKQIAENGFEIYGIDNSSNMIDKLMINRKLNLSAHCEDIRDFHLDKKFNFAFYSYSTFQYLLSEEDQISSLKNVYDHLNEGGFVAVDICPYTCNMIPQKELILLYEGFYPPKKCNIKMFTSHEIDKEKLVTTWFDKYILTSKNGETEQFEHHLSLKGISLDNMKKLFEKTGFELKNVFGDFKMGKVTSESDNLIFLAQKM